MGSLDRAVLTGFICRLCSEIHKVVIHIYGDEGRRLSLAEKINKYLPVNVSYSDPLPKTICKSCLDRLEGQHRLMMQIESVRKQLQKRKTQVNNGPPKHAPYHTRNKKKKN